MPSDLAPPPDLLQIVPLYIRVAMILTKSEDEKSLKSNTPYINYGLLNSNFVRSTRLINSAR